MPAKLPKDWKPVREALSKSPRTALTKLIQELYDLNPEVRKFLHARYAPSRQPDPEVLNQHLARIRSMLNPSSDGYLGAFPFADVRDLVRGYEKASFDSDGATLLLIRAATIGLQEAVHNEIDHRYPDGIYSLLRLLHRRLSTPDGRHTARKLQDEIRKIAVPAGRLGYGLGDEVPNWVETILTDLPPEEPVRRFDGDPDFDTV